MNLKTNKGTLHLGFSLIEMMVVVGVLVILISLLLPALNRARARADVASCMSSSRQLILGWQMYSGDHNDQLVLNIDGMFGGFTNWVAGNMGHVADSKDRRLLVDSARSLLSSYILDPSVYQCASDDSGNVRSVAMNCRMGPYREIGVTPRWIGGRGAMYRTFFKVGDIGRPSSTFVVIEEDAESINDAYFAVDMSNSGNADGNGTSKPYVMIDSPSVVHGNGAIVTFADGHSILKKWQESNTLNPKYSGGPRNGGRDARWLQEHSTYLE
jgi:prepilin-type N-terminal cleavage/methylation domain-containing protein/prepilin-type processing-associated H-X9-DG protein